MPVVGYGGIERAAQDLVDVLGKSHEVTVFGQVDEPAAKSRGWKFEQLSDEMDVMRHILHLREDFDVVLDFSHTKPLRMTRLDHYWGTTMWTDAQALYGRDIYPSHAVAEAFKDPKGRVIPLGIDTEHLVDAREPEGNALEGMDGVRYGAYLLAPGRFRAEKDQLATIRIWKEAFGDSGTPRLVLAGHTGAFADAVYSMMVRKRCRDIGDAVTVVADPTDTDLSKLIAGATGIILTHSWIESFNLMAAEALCMGVPVFTVDRGAPPEFVRELHGGMVTGCEPNASQARDLRAFVSKDWNRKGIAARARKKFDVRTIATEYEALFKGA